MSHYRIIHVNGKDYEYVIGQTVYIKGLGVFSAKVHGNPVYYPRSEDDTEGQRTGKYIVTPATIRALILGKETPVYTGPGEKRLMVNPFAVEVYDKIEYLTYDPAGYYARKEDI